MGREYRINSGGGDKPPQRPAQNANEAQETRETFRLNEGQGSLHVNKHKQPGDKRPSLTGKILINGQFYEVAVWKKEKRNGGGFWYSMEAHLPNETDAERPQNQPDYENQSQDVPGDW